MLFSINNSTLLKKCYTIFCTIKLVFLTFNSYNKSIKFENNIKIVILNNINIINLVITLILRLILIFISNIIILVLVFDLNITLII